MQNSDYVSISSNLVPSDIFNPEGRIFSINTQHHIAYVNQRFIAKQIPLNDVYINTVYFTLNIEPANNKRINIPDNLDFQIGIEFHEK